jgi:glycosyltransferase involved in cell wall biosynthesis
MKLAFLAYRGSMQSGGQGVYLHALTRELAARGHEIDCWVGPPYPDPMPWARVFPLENHRFWGARFDRRPGAFLPRPDPWRIFTPLSFYEFAVTRFGFLPEPLAFSLRAAAAVVRELRAGARYDVVHDVQSLGYGLLWLRALGLPVVSTVHHPLSVDRRSSLRRDRSFAERKGTLTFYPVGMQGRVARRIDAILTSSRVSRAAIEADFGVAPARIREVANGVSFPEPAPARARPARTELLFVGRCGDPNKGFEFLLRALALLPAEVGARVLDAEPIGTPLAEELDALGLRPRVRFDGKLSRAALERAYRDAAVVVVPSLFEGFGLPALEALAVGTPVVATTAGAAPEVLGTAAAGRLVPPADPAALAKGVAETLEDWPREHARARAARARLEAAYAWPGIAERTEAVYREVIDRAQRRRARSGSRRPSPAVDPPRGS